MDRFKNTIASSEERTKTLVDNVSVFLAFLFPVASGAILIRLFFMSGVPIWFYPVQGFIFLLSLALIVLFFRFGFRAQR